MTRTLDNPASKEVGRRRRRDRIILFPLATDGQWITEPEVCGMWALLPLPYRHNNNTRITSSGFIGLQGIPLKINRSGGGAIKIPGYRSLLKRPLSIPSASIACHQSHKYIGQILSWSLINPSQTDIYITLPLLWKSRVVFFIQCQCRSSQWDPLSYKDLDATHPIFKHDNHDTKCSFCTLPAPRMRNYNKHY